MEAKAKEVTQYSGEIARDVAKSDTQSEGVRNLEKGSNETAMDAEFKATR